MKIADEVNAKNARDAWLRALERTASIERSPVPMPLLIDRLASTYESAPALLSTQAAMSYRDVSVRCNQYARWGRDLGLKDGDSAALVMLNCAEYLCIWLGLTRIGVTVGLINTNLRGAALLHSITSVDPLLVIVGEELAPHFSVARPHLRQGAAIWVLGKACEDYSELSPVLRGFDGAPLTAAECAPPPLDAAALFIYTSGTTGMPKAAKVSHHRVVQWSHWFAGLMDTSPQDRMYDCLPLYHSVGGVVATGATLLGGGAVVIRARFSASEFWRDVVKERCTLFQYIGELCRYLVNSPEEPQETQHSLRLACGNGLRADVWETFQSRFKIPRILEYYASTEGNFSLYNCEGEPGAIGRIPSFLAQRLAVALLRFDVDSGAPWRNAAGMCERVREDEVGEAVGLMPEGGGRIGRFEGYLDPVATEGKVIRDVFKPGDAWYRTGDLMRRDARGFYYFVDRVGETFRWKGENVSTLEVLSVLSAIRGVSEGVVYGVPVPGADGRAGLAALKVDAEFDLEKFRAEVVRGLPSYARPVFLRLISALQTTDTFKPRKQELMGQGFDPSLIEDPLYFDDQQAGRYIVLDPALYAELEGGKIRV